MIPCRLQSQLLRRRFITPSTRHSFIIFSYSMSKRRHSDMTSPTPSPLPSTTSPFSEAVQANKRQATEQETPSVSNLLRTTPRTEMALAQPQRLPVVTLNDRETQLRGLLLDVAKAIDASPAPPSPTPGDGNADGGSEADKQEREDKVLPNEPVVLRWAGGWVRDKILGVESHDIDVAVNCMTGETFALRLSEFCSNDKDPERAARNREAHGIEPDDIGSLHKIARNPEKSKHLETTTVRLFGLDVDFVNLRRETYTQDSRNPHMEFGTAEEDALRRDATVNALFYNLHTGLVEDFTGGLADMEQKLIRTPLEPLQTFTDDPLRVLRLVRFASRLGFRIDEAAEAVMADARVLEALRVKISRERIGVELEKMLRNENACNALRRLDRLGLYHTVFTDSAREDFPRPDLANWPAVYECLDFLAKTKTPGSVYEQLVTSEEAAYFSWALAALVPWEKLPDDDAPVKPGRPAPAWAAQAAREGFRAPNRLVDVIQGAHLHRRAIVELKDVVVSGRQEMMRERDRFGMAIREWDSRGGQWRLQVLFAILVDIEARTGKNAESSGVTREGVLSEWQKFLDHLVELDVMDAPSMKRLVDGRTLSKGLGVKPGKWMMKAMDVAMAWQLRNPEVTDVQGAVDEVDRRREELGIR